MAGDEAARATGAVVIVNGQEKLAPRGELGFEDIVALAYDEAERGEETVFTVTFEASAGRVAEGEVGPGETLAVTERMILHVQRTDQS